MTNLTTVKVSMATRDELRKIAERATASRSTLRCNDFFGPSGNAKWALTWPLDRNPTRPSLGFVARRLRCPVRSGDIVRIDFGVPVGSTPALIRPAIVVTADLTLTMYSTTFHVVPVTTNVDRAWLSDVRLEDLGLPAHSVAQCHLCAVVDQLQVVGEKVGNVGPLLLAQIRAVVGDLLDIG